MASTNENDAFGARRVNSSTACAIKGWGIVTTAPNLTWPAVPAASAVTSRRASSICRRISRPRSTSTRPMRVNSTALPTRRTTGVPNASSISAICFEMAGCVTWNAAATRVT
ncbi:hypothetical protein FQZ97_635530 [compost metagenome]